MGSYLGKAPVFQQGEGEPNDLVADISAMRNQLHPPQRKLIDSLHEITI